MKRRLFVILTSMLLLLLFTGCGAQNYKLTINDDDSSTFYVKLAVDTTTYNLLSSYGINTSELNKQKERNSGTAIDNVDALFQETAYQFYNNGFDIAAIDDSIEIGFEGTKKYSTLKELNEDIQQLNKNKIIGTDINIVKESGTISTKYSVYGELNYLLDPDVNLDDKNTQKNFDKLFDKSKLTASLTVILPPSSSLQKYDGTIDQNKSAMIWNASYNNGKTPIHVTSDIKNQKAIAILGVLLLLIIIILIVAILKIISRANQSKNKKGKA